MVALTPTEKVRVLNSIGETIDTLSKGAKRTDRSTLIDFRPEPIEVTGYWVGDVMRIDIKL